MSNRLDLKQIERKAYRSIYQDGLWDVYYGLILILMAIYLFRPPGGYRPMNIVLMLGCNVLAYLLFFLGKKFITLPRMGQVKFGEARKKRKLTMILVLGIVVLIQAVIVLLTTQAWLASNVGNSLNDFLKSKEIMDLAVASIGALFVGSGMIVSAYFQDFPRGYYIAVLMMLAVFLMIYFNRPIYPIILGALIVIPGIVLFIRFLQKYSHPSTAADNE